MDAFIQLKANELEFVYNWRWEQECELIKLKGHGQSKEELNRFIERFMPAYYLYTSGLDSLCIPHLQISLDRQRRFIKSSTD